MPGGQKTRRVAQCQAGGIPPGLSVRSLYSGGPGMQSHPDAQWTGGAPGFGAKGALGVYRGSNGRLRRPEGRAEPIADDLEHGAVIPGNSRPEQLMVARKRRSHRRGLILPEPGAALNIREKEDYRT